LLGAKGSSCLNLFIVSCEEALSPEPTPFPFSPQRSMQADTGTILIGEDCGSISLPCMVSGVRVINRNPAAPPAEWTPCTSLPGGCLNVLGTPVFGEQGWSAAPAQYGQQSLYNSHLPHRDQRMDLDMARKNIKCPELNGLVGNMLANGDIWIGTTMGPVAGEFVEIYGKLQGAHLGTIYINTNNWEYDGFGYILKKDLKSFAELLAHEAAHAWFGFPNTVTWEQHIAIHNLAASCV
jgi:hypothetical protein